MWIEKTKNGKFKFVEQKTFPDGRTIRKSRVFPDDKKKTQRQAQELLNKLIDEEYNKIPTAENLTLGKLIDIYLLEVEKKYKPNTINSINISTNKLLNYFGRDFMVSKFDILSVKDFTMDLNTVLFSNIKTFFKWAYKLDYIEVDIGEKIYTLRTPVKRRKNKLYYEKEELEEVYSKLENQSNTFTNQELRLLVEFLVLTGLRIGEALPLTTYDIENYTLKINKNLSQGKILAGVKTKSGNREIILNNRAKQIILEMDFLKRTYGISSDIIFCDLRGEYSNYKVLTLKLNKIGVHGFHIFRHTHASLLAERGIPLEMIQRRLGHENDKITKDIYIHITKKQREKEIEIFRGLEL